MNRNASLSLLVASSFISRLLIFYFLKNSRGLNPHDISALFGTESMPPLPIFLLSAVSAATAIIDERSIRNLIIATSCFDSATAQQRKASEPVTHIRQLTGDRIMRGPRPPPRMPRHAAPAGPPCCARTSAHRASRRGVVARAARPSFGRYRATTRRNADRSPRRRLRAVKADIVANLSSRDLSVDAMAGRQGISSRYVQMLFEGEGTSFSEFVLKQRLALAHDMLADPRQDHLTITAIAYAAGFGDLSHFNHSFRRRYGATPTEVRTAFPSFP